MKHTVPPRKVDRSTEERAESRSFLGCDAHRKYSVLVAMDEQGRTTAPIRVEQERKELRSFLRRVPAEPTWRWKRPGVGTGWWTRSRRQA